MNKKVCDKCGNRYDDTLDKCPNCNDLSNSYNVKNMFLNNNDKKEENLKTNNINSEEEPYVKGIDIIDNEELKKKNDNIQNKENSIFFDPIIENKIEKINNRNTSLKKKKKKQKNYFYSYLLLVLAMILLFIVVISSLTEFSLILFLHYALTVIILMLGFNLTFRDIDAGYFLGIVGGVSMIFMVSENDFISAIIGVYIFTSSFSYMIKK